MRAGANACKIAHTRQPDCFFGVLDQISHPTVEHTFERLIEFQLIDRVWIDGFDFAVEALKNWNAFANLLECEQMGFVAVIEVGSAVGNFVGDIDELSFERRTKVEQIFGEFWQPVSRVIVRMLDDAFTNLEGQIESAESGVAQFEVLDDTQRVQVVVEERAVLAHGDVQRLFASVSEWRMADVMHQGERLDQINVQTQLSGDGSRDLRDLDGVGQAIAKVVRVAAGEDLSFSLEAAESSGMDYAIAVTLKVIAVGMVRLGI